MNRDPGVTTEVLPTKALTPQAWDEMWALTQAFYDTERAYVESKLKSHQHTVLFRARRDGALVGMASVDVCLVTFRGRKLVAIHTSHVLLREEYRGHNLLQKIGFRTFLQTRLRYPLRPIYWFFDTFSYKSYLLLPRNFREFWPRAERATPEREQALMHQLAAQTYGADWRPAQGIVVRSGYKRLRPEIAPLALKNAAAPELEFFARANPEHAAGDMLVCLCPLTLRNWMSAGVRAARRTCKSPVGRAR